MGSPKNCINIGNRGSTATYCIINFGNVTYDLKQNVMAHLIKIKHIAHTNKLHINIESV